MISMIPKGMISHWVANHGVDIYHLGQGCTHLHPSAMTEEVRATLGV